MINGGFDFKKHWQKEAQFNPAIAENMAKVMPSNLNKPMGILRGLHHE